MGSCSCQIGIGKDKEKEISPDEMRRGSHPSFNSDNIIPIDIDDPNIKILSSPKNTIQNYNPASKLHSASKNPNNNINNQIIDLPIVQENTKREGVSITKEEFDNLVGEKTNEIISENDIDFDEYITPGVARSEKNPLKFNDGSIYYGYWNNFDEKDGYGKYLLTKEGIFYEGVWSKNKLIYARIFLDKNEIYIGQIKDYKPHGKGTYIFWQGDIYEGDFDKGEMTGLGIFSFTDGAEYKGSVFNGVLNGKGIMTWKEGIVYEGGFINNYLSGYGVLSKGNEKYDGQFCQNLFHGKGKYVFDNGEEYYGDFDSGLKEGKGMFVRNDKVIFDGNWENDQPNGNGKIIYEKIVLNCNYRKGKLINYKLEKGDLPQDETVSGSKIPSINILPPMAKLNTDELSHLNHQDIEKFEPNQEIPFE